MGAPDYKKYFITRPLLDSGFMVYMSDKLVPGCHKYCEMRWVRSLPDPNPRIPEHAHHYDEILLYIGGPVLPLLLLAVKIGRWHNTHPESDE